jgi:predicted RNA-binding Zn ribbon-like protein
VAAQDPSQAVQVLEALLNTADRYNGVDELETVRGGNARLGSVGVLRAGIHLDGAGLRTMRAVRECLRRLAAANTHGDGPAPDDVQELSDLLAPGLLRLELQAAPDLAATLSPAKADRALPAALGTIAAAINDVVQADAWPRFKACANEDCQWAFYDRSRSRTGRWCDMRACGNLLKARAYRQRRAATR